MLLFCCIWFVTCTAFHHPKLRLLFLLTLSYDRERAVAMAGLLFLPGCCVWLEASRT